MNTYIAKPLKVEAVKLTTENAEEAKAWANTIQPEGKKVYHEFDAGMQWQGLVIPTLEGFMLCSIGDYLVKEPFPTNDRMFYPVKADIFERRYEPIETRQQTEITAGSRVKMIKGKNKGDEGRVELVIEQTGRARVAWDRRGYSTISIYNLCKI